MSEFQRETDLYEPIRDYLVANGYQVQAEVKGCDVVAQKENELVVVELKRNFSTRLLVQAIDRQKITDAVYVALPGPYRPRTRRWRDIKRLLRRLEIGLLVVTGTSGSYHVEIVFHPLPFQRRKRASRKRAVIRETAARSGDHNRGGSTRRPIMTAYRENAILIACCLDRLGPSSPKRLRELGTGTKTTPILSSNFYGWFRRVDRGVYELTPAGKESLNEYSDLVSRYQSMVDQALQNERGD
jgi:hypothetical protein